MVHDGVGLSPKPSKSLRINFSPCLAKKAACAAFLLLRQGSNLDSSDSESDVLPITPRSNFGIAKLRHLQLSSKCIYYFFATFSQVSLRGTVLLKIKLPGIESLSTQK